MSAAIAGVAVLVTAGLLARGAARRSRQARHDQAHERVVAGGGYVEPVSLHPRIDEHKCICTGACVTVCPEKDVLGMIDGRPKLLSPSACIGHGECLRACPVEAISLVLGSEKRGVELPLLGADFQTNVPGLYIAGELGGMGLIHNAVNQGCQAIRSIAAGLDGAPGTAVDGDVDVVIVGAGPAGLAATLAAKHAGLRYRTFDQDSFGGALRSYPRQKVVMTAAVDLPLYGKVKLTRTTKEALIELWEGVVAKTGVEVRTGCKVEEITTVNGLFEVKAGGETVRGRRVLLTIGRRGTPRKLGVLGEQLDKVTYKMLEPEQYRGMRCLVVGGGDSAVESALMLARQPGTSVVLAHRSERFDRIKPGNREALEAAQASRLLDVRVSTSATLIEDKFVTLAGPSGEQRLDNNYVFVLAGGELPTAWLQKMGIEVKTMRGEALPAANR